MFYILALHVVLVVTIIRMRSLECFSDWQFK